MVTFKLITLNKNLTPGEEKGVQAEKINRFFSFIDQCEKPKPYSKRFNEFLYHGLGFYFATFLGFKKQPGRKGIVFPNKQVDEREKFHNNHLLESETYIGGHVDAIRSGPSPPPPSRPVGNPGPGKTEVNIGLAARWLAPLIAPPPCLLPQVGFVHRCKPAFFLLLFEMVEPSTFIFHYLYFSPFAPVPPPPIHRGVRCRTQTALWLTILLPRPVVTDPPREKGLSQFFLPASASAIDLRENS